MSHPFSPYLFLFLVFPPSSLSILIPVIISFSLLFFLLLCLFFLIFFLFLFLFFFIFSQSIGQFEIVGKGWDAGLGGFAFDVRLAEMLGESLWVLLFDISSRPFMSGLVQYYMLVFPRLVLSGPILCYVVLNCFLLYYSIVYCTLFHRGYHTLLLCTVRYGTVRMPSLLFLYLYWSWWYIDIYI